MATSAAPEAAVTPAPIAPAPVTPAPVTPAAPQTATDVLAAARERLAKGESILAGAAPVTPSAPAAPADDPALADPAAPAGEEPAPGDPEAPESVPSPAEGAEAAGDPALVVDIPARQVGEKPIPLVVDSPETAERLRQLVNSYERKADSESRLRQAEGLEQEYEQVVDYLATAPAEFVLDKLPKDQHATLALRILAEPGVWERLEQQIFDLADPQLREMTRLKLNEQAVAQRDTLAQRAAGMREARQSAAKITRAVGQLVATFPAEQRPQAHADILQSIQAHAKRAGLTTLDPKDIPLVAGTALRRYGMEPLQAADVLANGGKPTPSSPANGRPPAPRKAPTGPELVAAQTRKAAAVTAPAGAGAPAAALPTPPKGQSITERIAWARSNGVLRRS